MKLLRLHVAAIALLIACAFGAAPASAQAVINCSPGTPCNSSTGPINTTTGDPAWLAFGKINGNFGLLPPQLFTFSTIPLVSFSASGCSNSTLLGGTRKVDLVGAGSFTAGLTGTCTVVLTFAFSAPNFWACDATDITSQIAFLQTARTANGCTVSGVAASGDIISLRMTGY